jgi:hypothetical protein
MAYTKKTWKNNETKLSADNLNTIENGLEAAATKADEAAAKAASNTTTINGHTTAINGLTTSLNSLTTTVNNNKTDANSKFTSVENRIAAVEQVNGTQNSTLSTLGTEITRVEGKFDSSVASLTSGQSTTNTNLNNHKNAKNNPHGVTAAQLNVFTKAETATLLSPGKVYTQLPQNNSSTITTTSISNLGIGRQRVIVNIPQLNITDPGGTPGNGALWRLTEDHTSGIDLYSDSDLTSFTDEADGRPYEIIDFDEEGSTFSAHYNVLPDNYLENMRYIYMVYTNMSSGWALNYTGDDAYQAFITIICYSPSLKKFFLVPIGYNGQTFEHFAFTRLEDRYLLIKGNCVYRKVVDLKKYADDLEFWSLGINFNTTYATSGTIEIIPTQCTSCVKFTLTSGSGQSLVSNTALPLANRDYVFDINASSSSAVIGATGYGQSHVLELETRYATNDNISVSSMSDHKYINRVTEQRELDFKIKNAVNNLIVTGTADPDASTPGLLYFKYLP